MDCVSDTLLYLAYSERLLNQGLTNDGTVEEVDQSRPKQYCKNMKASYMLSSF